VTFSESGGSEFHKRVSKVFQRTCCPTRTSKEQREAFSVEQASQLGSGKTN